MNKKQKKELEKIIESAYKLEKKIVSCVLTLRLETETHVPDLMTRIRILPSVAVVGQTERVARFMDGDAMLTCSIKFLPRTDEIYPNLKHVSTMIKKLPGVKSVIVDEYNKRKISSNNKKITF
tara:strand:+ start:38 stop:406 length:369 start_codon:yes stop_codon:yes gene_type:complete